MDSHLFLNNYVLAILVLVLFFPIARGLVWFQEVLEGDGYPDMVDEFQLYAHHPPSGYAQYLLSKTEQQKKLAYAADDIEAQFERLKYTPQPPRTLSIRCRYCGLKAEQTTGHCVGCGAPV